MCCNEVCDSSLGDSLVFCGRSISNKTSQYFRSFHQSNAEELLIVLDNESWMPIPVRADFSVKSIKELHLGMDGAHRIGPLFMPLSVCLAVAACVCLCGCCCVCLSVWLLLCLCLSVWLLLCLCVCLFVCVWLLLSLCVCLCLSGFAVCVCLCLTDCVCVSDYCCVCVSCYCSVCL